MGRNTSVTLGDHYSQFVAHQIASGKYETASEVMRAGLRLLEERDAQLTALNTALQAGEESGLKEFNLRSFLDRAKEQRARLDQ